MRRIGALSATVLLFTIGCGDDGEGNPMPPGEDLIGSWTLRKSSAVKEIGSRGNTIAFKRDGTVSGTLTKEAYILPYTGVWVVVEKKLAIRLTSGKKTSVIRGTYSTKGNTLTLHRNNGVVETYERT